VIIPAIAIALLLQGPPAARPAAAPASISGVVVQNSSGEPIANVRVALARTDAALGAFSQMLAGDRPPMEVTLPGEILAAMFEEMLSEAGNGNLSPEEAAQAKAISALPIGDIEEMIVSVNGDVAIVYKSAPPIMTDGEGRFAFSNVEPGTYKLVFASNGYARQDYGQRGVGGTGIPIVLTAGQAKRDIVMRMTQVSAIGGRIADASGRPVAGVPIQLFRYAYDESGQRTVQHAASAQTDDRGEYRIFYLSPGRYYLSAGNQPGQNGSTDLTAALMGLSAAQTANTNRIPEKYELRYYPGVADANSAAPIELPPGADLNGVDMDVKVQQTFRVRGSVVDPRSGQPPQSVAISLSLQSPDPLASNPFNPFVNLGPGNGPTYNSADGTFEIRNVSAGSYTINADLPNPTPQRQPDLASLSPADRNAYFEAQSIAGAARPKAFASVNVIGSDVEGLQLRLGTAGSIAGRFRSDQDPSKPAPEFVFLRVQFKAEDSAASAAASSLEPATPKPDGTFRLANLWPGEYRVSVGGLPSGFYLKEVRFGDTDVLNGHLRFSNTDSRTLDIVISPNSGQIEGTAADSQGRPVPGGRVVLIPERNRDRTELFRPSLADPSGHFMISAVPPGDYKLVAWESIEPYAFFDPVLIKQAEDVGKPIHIAESSKQTVNVIPIP